MENNIAAIGSGKLRLYRALLLGWRKPDALGGSAHVAVFSFPPDGNNSFPVKREFLEDDFLSGLYYRGHHAAGCRTDRRSGRW